MAWIKNGRKYWYHNGKRYSRRISNDLFNSYDFAFGDNFGKKGSRQRNYYVNKIMNEDLKNQELEKAATRKEKNDSFFNKYSENELNEMGFFSNEESYKKYKNNSGFGKPWWLDDSIDTSIE